MSPGVSSAALSSETICVLHTDVDDVLKGSVRRALYAHAEFGWNVDFGRPLTERICYVAAGRRFGGNSVTSIWTRCTHLKYGYQSK